MDVDLDGLFRQNTSYDYDQDYEYKEEFESTGSGSVLIVLLYSVVLVIGLLGNGLLLAVLAEKRRSWSTSDTFILHLCVADILLLVMLPFWAAKAASHCEWCFEGFLCKLSEAIFNINYYCGIFLLVCICLDRYLSIFHAVKLYSQKRPRIVHMSCLFVWLVCLILTIPNWIFVVAQKDQEKTQCVHKNSDWKLVSRLLHHTLGFLVPASILIICCSLIALRPQSSAKGHQKQRFIKVILPLVAAFFLCWMPYNITLVVDTISSGSKKPERGSLQTALGVTVVLGRIHACIRPLLYLGLCGNFRQRTLAMLRRAAIETENSLWELGVGEEALPDQGHEEEELKQMTSVDHQIQSNRC